jgi:drug/metabolite transporter (DMT)-like permease
VPEPPEGGIPNLSRTSVIHFSNRLLASGCRSLLRRTSPVAEGCCDDDLDGKPATFYGRGVFAAFLTTILFSVSVICGHRSARLIGGTEANFWRVTCATILLGAWAYLFGIGLEGSAFPMFLLSGLVGVGLGDLAFFQGLPRLGPQLAMLLIECLPAPLGALMEWCWLGTTLSVGQILCGLGILAGVGLALTPSERLKLPRRQMILGALFCTLGALGTAGGAVLSRKAYQIADASGQAIDSGTAGFQRVMGGLGLAAVALLIAKRRELQVQARAPRRLVIEVSKQKWRGVWPWVLMNSLAGQTLGVSCMQWALHTTPTGIVLAIIATAPIVVIPFAYFLEGQRPTSHTLAGGALAVAGVIALTLLK